VRRRNSGLAFSTVIAVGLGCLSQGLRSQADELDSLKVGRQPDGRIVVPTNQFVKPAGKTLTFPGRPVDMVLCGDGRTLCVKNMHSLDFVEIDTGKIVQSLPSSGLSPVGLLSAGTDIFVSNADNEVLVARGNKPGKYAWLKPIKLAAPAAGGAAYPTGLAAVSPQQIMVAANRGNCVQLIDTEKRAVLAEVAVGVAPFAVICPRHDRIYVTNWGGNAPEAGSPAADSSGTRVRIDARTGVASQGTVSVLAPDGGKWKQIKTIEVGLHPSGMALSSGGRFLYVANAYSDTVSVIDTTGDRVVETIDCRPQKRMPFGSSSNAVALSADGSVLYVANGTNNCLAVVALGRACAESSKQLPEVSRLAGLIPTGWYPGAIVLAGKNDLLCVANVKGCGSLAGLRGQGKGKAVQDFLGSLSLIPVPDQKTLCTYTEEVNANNRLSYSLSGLDSPRADARPVPVPARHGEPSLIKHVIYVIKENRTYDQVLGDMKEGNGEKSLVIFGEPVTPNQHKLSRQFTLFDNFYCSGVYSVDGHQWTNESFVTDYLEKAFGELVRSNPGDCWGTDPLAYAPTGFLWDNALAHKKTFINYGEFADSSFPQPTTWSDCWSDYKNKTNKFKIKTQANMETLVPYTRTNYPGWLLSTPDVARAATFISELKTFEEKGELPNLVYLYLPCDHTTGTCPQMPTPRAAVADNDLALGMVVEAVSKSRFWADTAIFVVEDDPQDGFDHVDGHRSVAQVLSPYTRRGFVDHTAYNQTGVVKTIELILGLPPMNQLDLSATPMRACFQDKPDLSPYICVPNSVPLDELNPAQTALNGPARKWAAKSLALDFSKPDLCNEDTLNRILWHSTRGNRAPYPRRFVSCGLREDD
jgi:YVTN family beta-propeller protein